MRRIIAAAVIGYIGALSALAHDTNKVLNLWFAAQEGLKDWRADFTQTRTMRTLTHPLLSSGRVWYSSPNRFRWELGSPARTIAMRDDLDMWVIYPLLKRAEHYPLKGPEAGLLGEALELLDAGFPRDRKTFDARFRLKSMILTNGCWEIDLQPVKASTRRVLPTIRVNVDTNTFLLVGNEILLPDGSSMRNEFRNAVVNGTNDATLFKPSLENDVMVSEPMKK